MFSFKPDQGKLDPTIGCLHILIVRNPIRLDDIGSSPTKLIFLEVLERFLDKIDCLTGSEYTYLLISSIVAQARIATTSDWNTVQYLIRPEAL